MKRIIPLLSIFLLFSSTLFAQGRPRHREDLYHH